MDATIPMIDPGSLRYRMTLYTVADGVATRYKDAWFAIDSRTMSEMSSGSPLVDIANEVCIDPAAEAKRWTTAYQLRGRYDATLVPTMRAVWGSKTLEFTDVVLDEISKSSVTITAREIN